MEMMMVLAISIIVSVISVMSLVPTMRQYRITNAYNTTLAAMRQARDNAVSQQTSYSVTFSSSASPNTITLTPMVIFNGDVPTTTYSLPTDVSFLVQTGFPSPGPDSYGTGVTAIDFGYTATSSAGGATTIYFCPDGSAQTTACGAGSGAGGYAVNWDGGVVYLGRSGDVLSSRAVTLWGGTGRIHGWRLYAKSGGGYQWLRQ